MTRIRSGEALTGLGAAALFVLLFFDWFSGRSGWSSLGWAMVALLVVVTLLAAIAVAAAAAGVKPAIAVGSAVLTIAVAAITLVVALIRVLLAAPGDAGVTAAGYLGLAAIAVVLAGAWIVLADERTDAPYSAYTPPPPRSLPDG